MQRFYQLLFAISLLAFSWQMMLVIHELGHAAGAVVTGGQVQKVLLHPLAISRVDVSPNPHPATVIWSGPILGCLIPLGLMAIIPKTDDILAGAVRFFTGFCWIANGAYIGLGSFGQIGDCGVMLQTGTPHWVLLIFGVTTTLPGILLWNQLGSLKIFWHSPKTISVKQAYTVFILMVVLMAVCLAISRLDG